MRRFIIRCFDYDVGGGEMYNPHYQDTALESLFLFSLSLFLSRSTRSGSIIERLHRLHRGCARDAAAGRRGRGEGERSRTLVRSSAARGKACSYIRRTPGE